MERNPHLLIEGCAIGCYAIGAKVAYIYIRGEFFHVQHVLERAIDEAYARGFLGKNILGSGFDCDVYVHRGAGAYEAGEETALLESLEGKRAQPRNKPPFPAVVGLYGKPTAVNNVETLCNVPLIVAQRRRVVRRARPGEERRPEAVLRQRPREAARRVRSVDEHHAARADRRLRRRRARRPDAEGGDPRRIVGADPDARSARHAGELRRASRRPARCSARPAIVVLDDTTCMVWLAENLLHFYRHESCGKCTPCREGTDWLYKILQRIERGEGQMRDLDLLVEHLRQHRRQDAVRVRRRRGHAGADDAEALPARVRGAHQGRALHAAAPTGARGSRSERTDARRDTRRFVVVCMTPLLIAQIVLTLFVFVMLLNSAAVMVYVERKVAALLQQRLGPYLRRPEGPAAAARRRHQADVQGGAAAERGRSRSSSRWRRSSRRPRAFAAFAVVPFGAETTLFGLLRRAAAAAGGRRQRRGPRRSSRSRR